jgi:hypothetical protein
VIPEWVEQAAEEDDEAIEALTAQAVLDPASLTPYLFRLLEAEVYWPQALYRAAGENFQRELVTRIDAGHERLYALLLILGHTRGPVAEQAFRRWLSQPPPGAGELGVEVAEFCRSGGWDIRSGGVHELCGADAYRLVLRHDERAWTKGVCPWCASSLWTALDVDTADPQVAEAVAHTGWRGRLRIITCYFCSCYGTTYADVTPLGGMGWSLRTTRPEYLPTAAEEPPRLRFTLGERRPTPYAGSAWERGGSTLGGHPDWIQDPAYPYCAACGEVMDYVGLVQCSDVDEFGEGSSYLFLHSGCRLAAVVYQQS